MQFLDAVVDEVDHLLGADRGGDEAVSSRPSNWRPPTPVEEGFRASKRFSGRCSLMAIFGRDRRRLTDAGGKSWPRLKNRTLRRLTL